MIVLTRFSEIKLYGVAHSQHLSATNLKNSQDFMLKLGKFSLKLNTNYCLAAQKRFSTSCSNFFHRIIYK